MPSPIRESVERVSAPVLIRLSGLPRVVPFLAILALMLAGILVDAWGWVLIAVVAAFLGWVLFLSWPRLTATDRLMRSAVLVLAIALALTRAFPRT